MVCLFEATYLVVDHGLDVDHASLAAEQHILGRGCVTALQIRD
jgi:hypothetical protein